MGISGRFPGAQDLNAFWRNLRDGVESMSHFTPEELEASGIDRAIYSDPAYVPAKGVLDDGDCFDGALFGYLPGESELMDPQMRVFHECVWAALEDAGYDPARYPGAIGLYGGAASNLYWQAQAMATRLDSGTEQFSAQHAVDKDFLCTQVSHKLGLRGPSVLVQTACSTSLVAVHVGCRALLTGECDLAVAGGVTISLPQRQGHLYHEGMILSKDAHCRAFDEKASGIVGGEGVGAVVLKTLKRAEADGDNIHAIIKGSAVNNDGTRRVGFAAPSPDGQAEVVAGALRVARVEPQTISYVETHGTGTHLGDPIEIDGLCRGFAAAGTSPPPGSCRIGSVKTNVGHLDSAAGIVSLLKTVLSLKHRHIPPSLHFERPNPELKLEETPFAVNATLTPWPEGDGPRRAGVSSFGTGGTNIHVILEEAPPRLQAPPPANEETFHLLPLAAATEGALGESAERLRKHLKRELQSQGDGPSSGEIPSPDEIPSLANVAYTLQVGRRHLPHRRTVVVRDREEAVKALTKSHSTSPTATDPPPVIFMFPGQGTQYLNMGRGLYRTESVFRTEAERCFTILENLGAGHVITTLWPEGEGNPAAVNATEVAQCGLFVLEFALAKLLLSWGISPAAMIGHSVGEYVAACLAEVLSLEDALGLMVLRGRLMGALPSGSMWTVAASEERLAPLLAQAAASGEDVSLAAINAPERAVISGSTEAVNAFVRRLEGEGLEGRALHTSHAFHSAMMEPILREFEEAVAALQLAPPQRPYISTLSGTWIKPSEAVDPAYWSQHLRHTVRFGAGLETLVSEIPGMLLEVGPGTTLCTFARATITDANIAHAAAGRPSAVHLLRPARGDAPDHRSLLEGIGHLWLAGVEVDWPALHGEAPRRRVSLPTYPFERVRLPPPGDPLRLLSDRISAETSSPETSSPETPSQLAAHTPHTPQRAKVDDWFYVPAWRRTAPSRTTINATTGNATTDGAHVLVFRDDLGLGEALEERLRDAGHRVVSVEAGTEFSQRGPRDFTLAPGNANHYRRLLADLPPEDGPLDTLYHLWTLAAPGSPDSLAQRLAAADTRGFESLCALSNALADRWPTESIRLLAVSNNMEEVLGRDLLHPEQTLILGPCGVIGKEYDHIICRSVDLDLRDRHTLNDPKHLDPLVKSLLGEMDPRLTEGRIALRGSHRWSHEVEPVALPDHRPPVRQRGVYLITGGLGGIGLALAEDLARTVQARLVLTGRSPLPPRAEWSDWLDSHGEDDPTSLKLRHLLTLEEAGAEVLALAADVADPKAMEAVLTQAVERFGTLHGVIHSAGLPDGGILRMRSRELTERVFAPKLAGTLVLNDLLADRELDFLVLCSSLASCLTDMGDVAYSSANAFLDAFASFRATTDSPGTTISLGWEGWREVGMAVYTTKKLAQDLGLGDYRALMEDEGLTAAEGVEAFRRILAGSLPHVMVSTVELRQRLVASKEKSALLEHLQDPEELASASTDPTATTASTTTASTTTASTTTANTGPATSLPATLAEAEQALAEQFEKVLGLPSIDPEANFFDLGVDSLGLIRVYRGINTRFPNRLAVQDLFDHHTIRALAQLLTHDEPAAESESSETKPSEPRRIEL